MSFALRRSRSQHLYTIPIQIIDIKKEQIIPFSQESKIPLNSLGRFSQDTLTDSHTEYKFLMAFGKSKKEVKKIKKIWIRYSDEKIEDKVLIELLIQFRGNLRDQKMNCNLKFFAGNFKEKIFLLKIFHKIKIFFLPLAHGFILLKNSQQNFSK